MKKFIVFFAAFVLISTTVFAQIDLNKRLTVGTSILNGNTLEKGEEEGSGLGANIQRLDYGFSVGGKNADNTFGFGGELENRHDRTRVLGFAWWQPLPEITIALGEITNWQIPLGRAGGDITGWRLIGTDTFHMDDDSFWNGGGYAGSVLKNRHGFFQGGAYTSMEQESLAGAVAIRPLTWFGVSSPNKLGILLFFPTLAAAYFDGSFTSTAKSVYLDRVEFQIVYDIFEVGQAAVSFRNSMRESGMIIDIPNDGNPPNYDGHNWYDESKAIYAQWSMNLPKKMGLEVGLQYTIAPADNPLESKWPVNIGLGWIMGDREEPFILSTRMGFQIPVEDFQNFIWGWDIAGNIKLGNSTRLYLPVGLGLLLPSKGPSHVKVLAGKDDDAIVYWAFSPFIEQDLRGPKVYVCFRVHNGQNVDWPAVGPNAPHNGEFMMGNPDTFMQRGKIISWNVPIYLSWSF